MNTMRRRRLLAAGAALAATMQMATPILAQETYPNKPIRMVIAFAAGGPTDVVGRLLAPRLSEILGQQVVVENKPGATGNIGTAMVADARPDGYTILFSASTMAMAPALYGPQLGYDPVNGLAAIAYVASVPLILLTPIDGAKSTAELVAMLRKDPGKYSYASSGNGGMIHLASYLFAKRAGGDALHVPYRGSAPGMVDMIAGRHGFQIDTLQSSKGFIDGNKVRVIGVAADKRLPQLPDVPTLAEVGYPQLNMTSWTGLAAPAGTPAPIVQALHKAVRQVAVTPAMVASLNERGVIPPEEMTPAGFEKMMSERLVKFGEVVRRAGITAE